MENSRHTGFFFMDCQTKRPDRGKCSIALMHKTKRPPQSGNLQVNDRSRLQAARHRQIVNLLVLDTREKDPSNLLYASLGFAEAGRIPAYAESADGGFDASVFYYKKL